MRGINRYSVTAAVLAVSVVGWNAYVAATADGVLEGRLVADDGRPVNGATVRVRERSMVSSEPRGEARSDADGRFRFEGLSAGDHSLEVGEVPGVLAGGAAAQVTLAAGETREVVLELVPDEH